jgi:hypothetical protein
MVEAKLLRKKLKNGLIVDKWDLVTIIEKQQAEIEALKQVLGRYVKEVPLGNQPHMLAHIALDLVNNG